jgi:Pyruvate/2-oxoacid:ferredoxin oxidoreductase gamma subunit
MRARKAIRKALKNQVEGRGFSLVEVLTACPSGWKVSPTEAIHWVEKNMIPIFPLQVFKDRDSKLASASGPPKIKVASKPADPSEPSVQAPPPQGAIARGEIAEIAMTLSGFGGQGVLFAGLALAEGALHENLQVSWIPSYGPEMRGGTAHCHVRVSRHPIASPWISRPASLMAFNQPSVDKFAHEVLPDGLILVNSSMIDKIPERPDVQIVRVPAYETAMNLGNVKNANMIMLGAYLEVTDTIDQESILSAFVKKGIKPEVLKGNREAIEAGRRLASGIRLKSKLA